jgi:uncharacterized protein
MRIFFATDLHGSDTCFRKFLAAKAFYSADVLILGGDYTGKALLPIVRDARGYHATHLGREHFLRSESETAAFEQRAKQFGLYTLRVDLEELHILDHDLSYRAQRENKLIQERLQDWISLALARLPAGTPIYICPGNDDDPALDPLLESSPPFVWIERRVMPLADGYRLMGFGGSTPTPWNTPREYEEAQISAGLVALDSAGGSWSRTICSIHVPPLDSGLDLCPELDSSLQIRIAPGQVALKAIGSRAVRDFILNKQPLLDLCGHVHEAQGRFVLGDTLCVNPGSTFNQGALAGVLVDLEDGKVQSMQFTSG